jgi:TP901 family phage tail tape measure protein
MPEDITQRLGFDASKAIQELTRLRTELTNFRRGLEATSGALRKFPAKATPAIKTMRTLAREANAARVAVSGLATVGGPATAQVGSAVAGSFNQATQAMQETSVAAKDTSAAVGKGSQNITTNAKQSATALKNMGTQGANATDKIALGWKLVTRIVQAQVIIRTLSAIIKTFQEATVTARDFSVAVAEAFTISGGELGTMDQMSDSVLKLSRALGEPALEVAEGLYQTLSNQVTEAGDALRFEAKAAELAIATHSELKDAVNALSSVMNSYGLEVAETEHVSDVLFKTIELGRLRLGEFGNVLGRVTPLTAALGISFEEMAASIAAITQKGVPAHTAITQLTQVSQKLLRPTQALQKVYETWGVETGPEAIRRFGGLREVLLKMKDATAGNDKEFADLLGRVRAMVGAMNLTTDSASSLEEALTAMENSTNATSKALEEMRSAVGRRQIEAWNRLKTTMIGAGQAILAVLTPTIEALDWMINNMDLLKAAAIGTAAGLVGLKLAAAGTGAQMSSLAAAAGVAKAALATLLPVVLAVAAVMATIQVTEWLTEISGEAERVTADLVRKEEEITRLHDEHSSKRIQQTRKEFEERRKATSAYFTAAALEYQKDFQRLQIQSRVVGETLEGIVDDIFSKRADAIKAIEKVGTAADNAIKTSMQEIADTQKAISEASFKDETRRMSARQKLWATIERTQDAAAKARQAYAKAGASEEATAAARELSHIAEKRALEAVAQAEKLGNYASLKRAEQELADIRAQRIKGEIQFQVDRTKAQSAANKKQVQALKESGIASKEIIKALTKEYQRLNETEPKSMKEMEERAERAKVLLGDLRAELKKSFDFDMFEEMGLVEGISELEAGVIKALSSADLDYDRMINTFADRIAAQDFRANITLSITNEGLLQSYIDQFGDMNVLGSDVKNMEKLAQIAEQTIQQHGAVSAKIGQSVEQIEAGLKSIEALADVDVRTRGEKFLEGLAGAPISPGGTPIPGIEQDQERLNVADQLNAKYREGVEIVRAATVERRGLTQAEADAINNIFQFGKAAQEAGEISKNAAINGREQWRLMLQIVGQLGDSLEGFAKEAELAPQAEESRQKLEEIRQKFGENAEAQKKVTEGAADTKKELQAGQQAQADMPATAAAATQALAAQTAQAEALKINLQDAAAAQQSITEISAGAPTAPTPQAAQPTTTTTITEAKQVTTEIKAQAEAAETFKQVIGDVQSSFQLANPFITEATSNTQTAAAAAASMSTSISGMVPSYMEVNSQAQQAQLTTSGVNAELVAMVTTTQTLAAVTNGWYHQLRSCAQAAGVAAQAMNSAASAARAAASACNAASNACSGGSVNASKGGRYFAIGGRGTDTIPAMLSPGEFIVNARSARNFFPQLQAINAGQLPTYREQGGSVTNVGDVNVTVQGGDNSQQTIREIAQGLRRELGRGTIKLT